MRGDGAEGPLLGRRAELQRLTALIEAARGGQGGAIRIDGVPGVGKSALLRAATPDDLPYLTTVGTETESALPFAGLEDLLHALDGGALMAGAEQDPAALLRRVSTLLADAAPLALLIDDAQWLDPSSLSAVVFLARRAHRLGIAVIAVWSQRESAPEAWPGVPVLALPELEHGDALDLARARGLADPVAEALVSAVGGNPLALVEAPGQLTAAQRAGRTMLPDPLPAGERLQRAYAARVDRLPPAVREALLRAAAGAPAALVAATLGPAEDAGLVRLGIDGGRATVLIGSQDGVAFTHPLVRAAVYHGAPPSERRAAHAWIADRIDELDRCWQRALSAETPDEALAAPLEELGQAALRRGAPGTAAVVLERAVRLTPDPERATSRAIVAATVAASAGQPLRARGVLDAVLPTVDDPGLRADVQMLRGMAIHQSGRPREAWTLLDAEATAIADADPGRATGLLIQASIALMGSGPIDAIAETARRARRLAPAGIEMIPAVIEAEAYVNLGDHGQARALLDEHGAALLTWDATGPGHEVLAIAGLCRLWLGDHDHANALLGRLVEANRAAGAVMALALPLAILASLHLRRGDFASAAACVEEATEIADTGLGAGFAVALVLAASAMVAAHRGDDQRCRAAATRMLAMGNALELPSTLAGAEQALGHLALSHGDAAAAGHFERALAHTAAHGTRDPAFLFTHADAVEALVRAERPADAARVLADLEVGAERTGGVWARAAVHRCRGLIGPLEAIDDHLEAALAAHTALPMPFEEARTRLVLGERLRRNRRRADARPHLRAAHETFTAVGARTWAARAARELAATGAHDLASPTPSSESGPSSDPLTAREHDVCELVAHGRTNREVAAALFLSPRTVEHHLRIAYRKLGVRSRTELAARYGRTGQPS